MGQSSEKKKIIANNEILKTMLYGSLACNLFYLLVRVLLFWNSFGFMNWVGYIFLLAVNSIIYVLLTNFAKGGQNLGAQGLVEYMRDLVYLGWIIQVLTCLSDWFWLIYVAVPIFAAYKLYGLYNQASSMSDLYSPTPNEKETPNNRRKK